MEYQYLDLGLGLGLGPNLGKQSCSSHKHQENTSKSIKSSLSFCCYINNGTSTNEQVLVTPDVDIALQCSCFSCLLKVPPQSSFQQTIFTKTALLLSVALASLSTTTANSSMEFTAWYGIQDGLFSYCVEKLSDVNTNFPTNFYTSDSFDGDLIPDKLPALTRGDISATTESVGCLSRTNKIGYGNCEVVAAGPNLEIGFEHRCWYQLRHLRLQPQSTVYGILCLRYGQRRL